MKKRVLLAVILCLAGISFDYSSAYFSDKLELQQNVVSIGNLVEENVESEEIENQEEQEHVEESESEDILSDEVSNIQEDTIQNSENLDGNQNASTDIIDEQLQNVTQEISVDDEIENTDMSVEN